MDQCVCVCAPVQETVYFPDEILAHQLADLLNEDDLAKLNGDGDGDRDRPSNRPRNHNNDQNNNAMKIESKYPHGSDNSDSEDESEEDDVIPEGKREIKKEKTSEDNIRKRKTEKSNEDSKLTSSSSTNTTARNPTENQSPQQKTVVKDNTQKQLEILRMKHAARIRSAENAPVVVSTRTTSTLNYLILAIALTIALLLLRKYHSAPGYNNW